MKKILKQSTINTCGLDPLPTSLLTRCFDDLLPHLTSILDDSLHSGLFPSAFKSAIVTPLLPPKNNNNNSNKKQQPPPLLNSEILKNYRPVSNLSFLSKILEKAVLHQLSDHLLSTSLFYSDQSAYRAGLSTETAFLEIVNDLLSAPNEDKEFLLSLLHLSAARYTIDHSIFLPRLSDSFGVSDNVLAWFTSYISDCTQTVSVMAPNLSRLHFHTALPRYLS